jgi:hypothetical protein
MKKSQNMPLGSAKWFCGSNCVELKKVGKRHSKA